MHFHRCVRGYVLNVIRKPRTPKLFLECYCMARKNQSGVSLPHTVILCLAWCKSFTREPHSPCSTSFRPFVLVLAHTCIRQNTISFEVYINMYVNRKKMHIKIRCIKYSETKNKINTGYPIQKRSVKQLAGFYKTLGWILSTFGGANASTAST